MTEFIPRWNLWKPKSTTDKTDTNLARKEMPVREGVTDKTDRKPASLGLNCFDGSVSPQGSIPDPNDSIDLDCKEGYWVPTLNGAHRIKPFMIVEGCRFAARIFVASFKMSIEIPPNLYSSKWFDETAYFEFLMMKSHEEINARLRNLRADLAQFVLPELTAGGKELIVITSTAGEFAVEAGLLPWKLEYCRIGLTDYEETITHERLLRVRGL